MKLTSTQDEFAATKDWALHWRARTYHRSRSTRGCGEITLIHRKNNYAIYPQVFPACIFRELELLDCCGSDLGLERFAASRTRISRWPALSLWDHHAVAGRP